MNMWLITANEKGSGVMTRVIGRTQICAVSTFVEIDAKMIVLAGLMRLQRMVIEILTSKLANFVPALTDTGI